MANLSNVINYCRVINGSKGFNDTKTQLLSEMSQDYNVGRQDAIYRFDVLINTIDAKDVYINDSVTPIKAVIDISKKQTADTGIEKRIQFYPNQMKQGDIIKFKINDTDRLRTYLIKSQIDKKIGYDEGIFEECNHLFKWMVNGKTYSCWGIATNQTKYTLGTDSVGQNSIIESDSRFNIDIPNNELTATLKVGDRLIFNGGAFKITQVDYVSSNDNIRSLLLGQDNINYETDDVKNEIPNAYVHKYAMTLPSTSESISIGGTYTIIPKVTDNGATVVNPSVVYKSSDTNIATVDKNGTVTSVAIGSAIITCEIDDTSIDLNISVIAKPSIPVTTYQTEISNGTVLRLASSTSLVCKKYSNSVQIPCNVQYTIDSVGQTLLSNKKIDVQIKESKDVNGNSLGMNIVWIKNLNVTIPTSFSITITDKADNQTITAQVIQLKGV